MAPAIHCLANHWILTPLLPRHMASKAACYKVRPRATMSVSAMARVPHLQTRVMPFPGVLSCNDWTLLGLQSSGGACLDGLKMDAAAGAADKENGGAGNGEGLPSCRPDGT